MSFVVIRKETWEGITFVVIPAMEKQEQYGSGSFSSNGQVIKALGEGWALEGPFILAINVISLRLNLYAFQWSYF